MEDVVSNLKTVQKQYLQEAPAQVRLLDAFLGFSFATGLIQVMYMMLVGTFPFNSFLAGISSCAGVFVFTRKFYA
jgi:oligosaccharyltransferase complex subunit epsilon